MNQGKLDFQKFTDGSVSVITGMGYFNKTPVNIGDTVVCDWGISCHNIFDRDYTTRYILALCTKGKWS